MFAGRRLFFAMATEHEYGPHLRNRITPLITGVGPVEAAVSVAASLAKLAAEGKLPDAVVSLGSAGSRTLDHAGLYQIGSVSYRDMDATALGFDKGQTPFLDIPVVVTVPARIPGLPVASIATGASIVSGAAYDGIEADMVDMESFAVLRAADRFDLPLIGLRGISDGKADLTGLHDWTEYLHVIDEKLGDAIDRIASAIDEGSYRFD
ncbi:MAG: 5'-methylthioadenosine/S-adenosylhomocysteine nucleosidase [Bauldia sp.]|nr:5'-methylthioadenosine/S-adenosylhomocysteine nucleosidase [Bauldia sp.]MCW5716620.1 5'-methylthioadenosine/S-adenosylhomocysteine nucleosidase [Bauldia sp.]